MKEGLSKAVREAAVDGGLACAAAFAIAERLGVSPMEVGEEADAQGIDLTRCQLGLFGYGPKAEGKHKRVEPMQDVPSDWAAAIRGALNEKGRLACADAWRIAEQFGMTRQMVSNAAEGMGLRVTACQIGAF